MWALTVANTDMCGAISMSLSTSHQTIILMTHCQHFTKHLPNMYAVTTQYILDTVAPCIFKHCIPEMEAVYLFPKAEVTVNMAE